MNYSYKASENVKISQGDVYRGKDKRKRNKGKLLQNWRGLS